MKKLSGTSDSVDCKARRILPPLSDRMRKRKAFADKELDDIMMQREMSSSGAVSGPRKSETVKMQHHTFSRVISSNARCIIPSTSFYPSFNMSPYSAFFQVRPNLASFNSNEKDNLIQKTDQTKLPPSPTQTPPDKTSPNSFSVAHLADDSCHSSIYDNNAHCIPNPKGSLDHMTPPKQFDCFTNHAGSLDCKTNLLKVEEPNTFQRHENYAKDVKISKLELTDDGAERNKFLPRLPNVLCSEDFTNTQQHLDMLAKIFPKLDKEKIDHPFLDRTHNLSKTQVNNSSFSSLYPCKAYFCSSQNPYSRPSSFILAHEELQKERLAQIYFQQIQARDLSFLQSNQSLNIQHHLRLCQLQKLYEQQMNFLESISSPKNLKPSFKPGSLDETGRNDNYWKRQRISSSDSDISFGNESQKKWNNSTKSPENYLETEKHEKENQPQYEKEFCSLWKPRNSFSNRHLNLKVYQALSESFQQNGAFFAASPTSREYETITGLDDHVLPTYLNGTHSFGNHKISDTKLSPFSVQSMVGKAKA